MQLNLSEDFYGTFGIVVLIAVITMTILFIAAEWKILKKAGEKGWKSLIPFYSVFVSHHIAGMSHAWFIIEAAIWIAEIMFEIIRLPEPVVFWFGVAAGIFTLISELIHVIRMCSCFGKGIGFKIGMFLIPNLFMMILAYGKAEYTHPEH